MERRRRVRLVEPGKSEPGFTERLEAQARRILEHPGSPADQPALSLIERQLAFTLHQLDEARRLHREIRGELHRTELYVYNELLRMQPRPFEYHDNRGFARERLADKLAHIRTERRRLMVTEHDRHHVMHDRLLSLLNRHTLLRL